LLLLLSFIIVRKGRESFANNNNSSSSPLPIAGGVWRRPVCSGGKTSPSFLWSFLLGFFFNEWQSSFDYLERYT
jgi:hypothetical protein